MGLFFFFFFFCCFSSARIFVSLTNKTFFFFTGPETHVFLKIKEVIFIRSFKQQLDQLGKQAFRANLAKKKKKKKRRRSDSFIKIKVILLART